MRSTLLSFFVFPKTAAKPEVLLISRLTGFFKNTELRSFSTSALAERRFCWSFVIFVEVKNAAVNAAFFTQRANCARCSVVRVRGKDIINHLFSVGYECVLKWWS